jgi:hypothetical protein
MTSRKLTMELEVDDDDDDDAPFLEIGKRRLMADRRQLAGLMLVLGTCAAFQPLASVASLTGIEEDVGSEEDVGRSNSAMENALLASGLVQVIFGILAMIVGYLYLVHDYSDYRLTGVLILLTQLAWMPFITGMVEIGKAASGPYIIETRRTVSGESIILQDYVVNPFIPEDYLPNERDVQFFGAIGILGILSYGTGFIGSLAFTEFALYAFDVGKPTHRDARYYRGRLVFYSFVMAIAGISQLLLGSYILFNFGNGPLIPSVGVSMYQVYFPEITVAIGCTQVITGYFGVGRYLNYVPVGPNDHQFQIVALVGWLLQLSLQYIVQICYGPNDENAASLPSLALLSLGLNILPAFLDLKMRSTPMFLTNEYYGLRAGKDEGYTKLVVPRSDEEQELERAGDEQRDGNNDTAQDDTVGDDEQDGSITIVAKPNIYDKDDTDETKAEGELARSVDASIVEESTSLLGVESEKFDGHELERDTLEGINSEINVGGDTSEDPQDSPDSKTPRDPPESPDSVTSMDPPLSAESRTNFDDDEDDIPPVVIEETVEIDGVIVEQTTVYPDDNLNSQEGDDDTPPQSNKSFETDMEDTWGENRTSRLATWMEEGNESLGSAILEGGNDYNDRYESLDPPGLDDDDDRIMRQLFLSYEGPQHVSSDDPVANYDGYASDEYPEISEASPDDDTVTLEAKIERLRKEVIAETIETYLSEIL